MLDRHDSFGRAMGLRQVMDRLLEDAFVMPRSGEGQDLEPPGPQRVRGRRPTDRRGPVARPEARRSRHQRRAGRLTMSGQRPCRRSARSAITSCASTGPVGSPEPAPACDLQLGRLHRQLRERHPAPRPSRSPRRRSPAASTDRNESAGRDERPDVRYERSAEGLIVVSVQLTTHRPAIGAGFSVPAVRRRDRGACEPGPPPGRRPAGSGRGGAGRELLALDRCRRRLARRRRTAPSPGGTSRSHRPAPARRHTRPPRCGGTPPSSRGDRTRPSSPPPRRRAAAPPPGSHPR